MSSMSFTLTPYAIFCAISACIAAFVVILAWQRRSAPAGTALVLLMTAVAVWSMGAAFEYAALGIPAKVFFSKILYIGVLSTPVFFFLFALQYSHLNKWVTKRNIFLLFVIPFITCIMTLTNELHGLIWSGFILISGDQNYLIYEYGFWYWIGVNGYSYILMFVGMTILIWGATRLPSHSRSQATLVIIATLLPLVVSVLYEANLISVPGLEPTIFAMVLSGVIFVWAISYFYLLDLAPLARHTLIETMSDGMLVLDENYRVIDVNPAVQHLLKLTSSIQLKNKAEEVFKPWPDLLQRLHETKNERIEIVLNTSHNSFLEIILSPLQDEQGSLIGILLVLRNITDRKRAEDEIKIANERLSAQLAKVESLQAILREQVIRDALTGLFNRRYLDESLGNELAHAKREGKPVSILMMDIDHFKELNDAYGHKAGDQMLKAISRFLLSGVRQSDMVCRYGGEEFTIIMPGASLEDAKYRAETFVSEFRDLQVFREEQQLKSTISVGVAIFPEHGKTSDELIQAADTALYMAKKAGRNRVAVKPLVLDQEDISQTD